MTVCSVALCIHTRAKNCFPSLSLSLHPRELVPLFFRAHSCSITRLRARESLARGTFFSGASVSVCSLWRHWHRNWLCRLYVVYYTWMSDSETFRRRQLNLAAFDACLSNCSHCVCDCDSELETWEALAVLSPCVQGDGQWKARRVRKQIEEEESEVANWMNEHCAILELRKHVSVSLLWHSAYTVSHLNLKGTFSLERCFNINLYTALSRILGL